MSQLRSVGNSTATVAHEVQDRLGLGALAAWRIANSWSQTEVAARWTERWPDDAKTSKSISYWEQWPSQTGRAPSLGVLNRLAQLYGCSVADLVSDLGNYRRGDQQGPASGRVDGQRHARNGVEKPGAVPVPDPGGRQFDGRADTEEWYTSSLTTLLRLDVDPPEAIEEREIVSTVDGLSEVTPSISVPRHSADADATHGLEVELLFGGRLTLSEQPYESYFRQVISLAEPLMAKQRHRYSIRHRLPTGQTMAPFYVYVPHGRADAFSLRIRFDTKTPPRIIWKLEGVPTSVAYNNKPTTDILVPDRFGETSVCFESLRQGFAHGIRWLPMV